MPKRNLLIAAAVVFILSLISAFYFRKDLSVAHEQRRLQNYILHQQRDYESLISDSVLMRRLILKRESLNDFKSLSEKEYGVFIFAETLSGQQELLFWNNQKIVPPVADYTLADGEYFQYLANGYYLMVKKTIRLSGMSNMVTAYALIPILYQYFLETNYLHKHFAYDEDAIQKIFISDVKTRYALYSLHHRLLFYINRLHSYSQLPESDAITIALQVTAFILLLLYIHFWAQFLTAKRGAVKGILFLATILISVRLMLYILPDVFQFKHFELFSEYIFSDKLLNRSLGDLLLNAILFCWLVVFAWYNIGPIGHLPAFLKGRRIWIAGILDLFFFVVATFKLADIVRSLVTHSKISFDVSNFFSLNIYSVIGFVVLALISLGYYYFTRLLFKFIFAAFGRRTYSIYFIIPLLGLGFLSFTHNNDLILFHLPVLAWIIIYTLLFSREQFIINRFKITVAGILFWIFIFSVSLAVLILNENRKVEWVRRMELAKSLDQRTDPSNQNTLSIALTYLNNRFLLNNFSRFQNKQESRYLRDSILNENFAGYISGYNTKLYLFDSLGRGVHNDDPESYDEMNTIISVQSKPTNIPDLYYHEISYGSVTYITKREIKDSTHRVGTFFVLSTPKQFSSDALYPELLRSSKQTSVENSQIYSYAVYDNDTLRASSNIYPFVRSLTAQQMPKAEFERRINDGNDELWYRANNKRVVVIAKKQNSIIESITLFSWLFCAFLFMIAVLQLMAVILQTGNDWRAINALWQLNIRSQVHSIVIFISLISFVIIGISTISFFIGRYTRNNIDRLSKTANIMVSEMQKRLSNDDSTFYNLFTGNDSAANYNLQKLIDEVADIHGVDINVYDTLGDLKISSDKNVYNKGVLSNKMHPEAYFHLSRLKEVQYVHLEAMSSLEYLSIYAVVRDKNWNVRAYLNIPYFTSQIDLNQEINNFLVTVIDLNAFIFLIAGVVALFITNTITRSFSVIGDKMKAITLGKTNEEIVWARNDEIGQLVEQYNKMVHQLEQSAEALARSEREGAWREMARQVAHEIKNPLTPMKLSIQYLQRAVNNNQPNVKELTGTVANTLVEQIDHLSKIAADFSQFANIGNKNIEVFDAQTVLAGLLSLYRANPKVEIIWRKVRGQVMMEADKTHMNRLFTNLLTNAIDACSNKERCVINIDEQKGDGVILFKIKDNGEGIPDEVKSKIFTPNFTTKTSGTGLGLAMCKSIVEQAGGTIRFETERGVGTTFFVTLPLIS